MSKRTNNRFIIGSKNINSTPCRKCSHHVYSHNYAANMRQHDDIIERFEKKIAAIDMDSTINIKIAFHFVAPKGSYGRERVISRVHDIIMSINDDFNNYSNNPNTMNNFRYKSIINQVFLSNMPKQNIYLGNEYLKFLPIKPANIIFELGEIYFYPVKKRLNLSQHDDISDVEVEFQLIKQYVYQNRANAINPDSCLNIWIIDMNDTSILGFSNFPWEVPDNCHGIIIHRRSFFPEDYDETGFCNFKTFTHHIGHYFGLLHVIGQHSGEGVYSASNINTDSEKITFNPDIPENVFDQFNSSFDPTDKTLCKRLHNDVSYNPLFMNFMDYTCDKYMSMFTQNQIQKMRYMILNYRPKINAVLYRIRLPVPRYNPDTDTITGDVGYSSNITRRAPLIPSREEINNPRLTAQGFVPPEEFMPPQLPEVPSEPVMVAPNLCATEQSMNPNGLCSRDQVIANIKSVMTPSDSAKSIEPPIRDFRSYNSVDGYAQYFQGDNNMTQELQKQMAMMQHQRQKQYDYMIRNGVDPSQIPAEFNSCNDPRQTPIFDQGAIPSMIPTMVPEMDPRITQQIPPPMPNTDPRMNGGFDPRMNCGIDPRITQQTDPRMNCGIDPRITQQADPRMNCGIDPRITQQADPRIISAMAPGPDPRMMQQPEPLIQQPMDPRMACRFDPRMMHPWYMPKNNSNMNPEYYQRKTENKHEKRIDPQFVSKKNNCEINDIDDSVPHADINYEALRNLRSQRSYPKYASAKPDSKINSLDPKYQPPPTSLKEVTTIRSKEYIPPHMAAQNDNASNLANRISNIDEQLKNIKAKTNFAAKPTVPISQPNAKFDKYGQKIDKSREPAKIMTQRRFTRTKPV